MFDDPIDIEAIERRAEALVEGQQRLMRDLVAMRTKHELTQADVAERMGVSQPTVAAFERYDSNPTLASIRRYALAVHAHLQEQVLDACAHTEIPAPMLEAIVRGVPAARFRKTAPGGAERWTPVAGGVLATRG